MATSSATNNAILADPVCAEEETVAAEQGAAVAAPVNEDLNEEEDEGTEENALVEGAVAANKTVTKAVTKQQKVAWVGKAETGTSGNSLYRCDIIYISIASEVLLAINFSAAVTQVRDGLSHSFWASNCALCSSGPTCRYASCYISGTMTSFMEHASKKLASGKQHAAQGAGAC